MSLSERCPCAPRASLLPSRAPRYGGQLRRDWSSITVPCETGCASQPWGRANLQGEATRSYRAIGHTVRSTWLPVTTNHPPPLALSRRCRAANRQKEVSPMPETPRRDATATRGEPRLPLPRDPRAPGRLLGSVRARRPTPGQIRSASIRPLAAPTQRQCETAALAGGAESRPATAETGRKEIPGEHVGASNRVGRTRAREGGGPR
jgi:hypothetical protein